MDASDDQHVVNMVLMGDINAFGVLVQRYQTPIFNLMFRVAGSTDEAAELTQDTFIKTYQNLERFQLKRRFFPWLYAIGLNVARDFARKNKCHVDANSGKNPEEYSGCDSAGEQEKNLCEALDFQRLEKALCGLPVIYREALVLRYHEELSMQDVAQALSVSVSAAKMRVSRGLEMLRQSFKGVDHEK
jgi:RNA polymerase sigma-70 factor (ECF subfamily)